ncbi:MAG TPA: DUF1810 domain-containing protein [Ktedonobacterales bacterium]|nr:DUF1810 domain-containing protein [Ktedonobacterales bacterium]
MNDPYKLERFITAQNDGGTYCRAVEELRRGHKTSHWMWFVFPQIAGLGQSRMSRTYPLSSLAEAKAYLQHPVLGQRLIECAGVVASAQAWTAEQIFGDIDTQKLHSSMTLFLRAEPNEPLFRQVLDRYFDGIVDSASDQRLLSRFPRDRGVRPRPPAF